jgi:acetyl esterase/lipase
VPNLLTASKRKRPSRHELVFLLTFLVSWTWIAACGQSTLNGEWASTAADRYKVFPDITYMAVDGSELKLDVYNPRESSTPVPVIVYFHGGGWVRGDKGDSTLQLLPYLRMGWAAVNVNYRLAGVALAPAAVEDCRCALRWVAENAGKYNLDPDKIILTGHSSGGHLALMAGIAPESAGYDRLCPNGKALRAAAIVNWFGVTDVGDLLSGRDRQVFAAEWLGERPDRGALATRLSPLSYMRKGLPPIITIHGDADPTVPYSQAVRLHQELSRLGVKNQLYIIRGGKHGWFDPEQDRRGYAAIKTFLATCGLKSVAAD